MGLPSQKPCRIIVLDNNVPQISLTYQPIIGDSVPEARRSDWEVSYELGDNARKAMKTKRQNSSLFKVDVIVYPELSFQNLIITQVYQVLFNISPAIEISLWKGMKIMGQVIFPIYNEYGDRYRQIREGYITLSQSVRLPYNTFVKGTIGTFNARRWGFEVEAKHFLKWNSHFSVEGRIGYTGASRFENFAWHVSPLKRLTWSVGPNYYWSRFNTEFSVRAEQYLLGERGVRFDMRRDFRYASVGFYAMSVENANKNGGFYFQIMLPPYGKYKRKYVRVMPSKYFGVAYNAGNERYYGKSFAAELNTTYGYRNSFNPFYIKSELVNF